MENYRNSTGALRLTNKSSDLLEKACDTVDNCLRVIEDQVARYEGEKMREAPAFVAKSLFENVSLEESFHHLMISDCDILRLQQKIITILNKELTANGYFLELKSQPVEINVKILREIAAQNRGVMKASALASAVGGWAAGTIVGGAVEGILGGELIECLIGGNAFEKARNDEETACAERLLLSVTGLIRNIGRQICEQLSYQAATAVYSYDDKDITIKICAECDIVKQPA